MADICDLLTVVIPVKNEEKNLPACLESLKGFKRVVLVDSGSTDRTKEIFSSYASSWEILDFNWNGQFPKKRNWTLRNYKFQTPWVMFLDADERLTPAWLAEAERVLASTSADAFVCYYDNWFMGRMLRHGDVMQKTAILRVGAGEYERIEEQNWSKLDMEIHEQLQVKGPIGEIRAHLEHHDHRSLESYYAKHEEYAAWEANRYRALLASPGDRPLKSPDFTGLTRRQRIKYALLTRWWFGFAYFCACYFLKLGFLDGIPGFVFARGKMRYFRNIRRKITIAL